MWQCLGFAVWDLPFFCDAELHSLTRARQSRKHWERRRQSSVTARVGGRIGPHTREREVSVRVLGAEMEFQGIGPRGPCLLMLKWHRVQLEQSAGR